MKSLTETKRMDGPLAQDEAPRTLRQLGIDGGLAAGFELALGLMGAVQGGRVVGYAFTTPDGRRHALRVEQGEARSDVARAA